MIPKIIHYAWLGGEIPERVQSRILHWKLRLPGWKFKLWNEDNVNFLNLKFAKFCLEKGKFAYATDQIRLDVINKYGGFWLDTDTIVKKDLNPLLGNHMTWGFMYDNSLLTSFFGSEPNQAVLSELADYYQNEKNFDDLFSVTNNTTVTNYFIKRYGKLFKLDGSLQELEDGIVIYPRDYFCYPSHNSNANYAEHLFDNSWGNGNKGLYKLFKYSIYKIAPVLYGNIANLRGVKRSK